MFCSACIDSLLKFSLPSSKTSKKAVNFLQASGAHKKCCCTHTMFRFRAALAFWIAAMKAWIRLLMVWIHFSIPVWSLCASAVLLLPPLPESSLWRRLPCVVILNAYLIWCFGSKSMWNRFQRQGFCCWCLLWGSQMDVVDALRRMFVQHVSSRCTGSCCDLSPMGLHFLPIIWLERVLCALDVRLKHHLSSVL